MVSAGLSNNPFGRTFVTEPMTAGVAFSPQEVDQLNSFFAKEELKRSETDAGDVEEAVRISNLKFFRPDRETAWIFQKLNEIIEVNNRENWNFDLTGYEAFQYAEYVAEEGGKYDFHADLDYTDRRNSSDLGTRKLALSLILSEPGVDFEGGDFEILIGSKPITCRQAKGMVILFPSWVLHRVTPVTKGVRKSIVVWVTGPKFR